MRRLLVLIIPLAMALCLSSIFAAYSYYTTPSLSSPARFALNSTSVSPTSLSPDLEAGVLSFLSSSTERVVITPSSSSPLPSWAILPYAENMTFSLSWGSLRLWNASVSPGLLNGTRVYAFISSSSPSGSQSVLAFEGRMVNSSNSTLITFEREGDRVEALLGKSVLWSGNGKLTFSPEIEVSAEKGALVLLHVNYVSVTAVRSMEWLKVQNALRSFLYSMGSYPLFLLAVVERRRIAQDLAIPFAAAAVTLLLAAAVAFSLGREALANSLSVYAYYALIAAVVAAAARAWIEGRRKNRKEKADKKEGEEKSEESRGAPSRYSR